MAGESSLTRPTGKELRHAHLRHSPDRRSRRRRPGRLPAPVPRRIGGSAPGRRPAGGPHGGRPARPRAAGRAAAVPEAFQGEMLARGTEPFWLIRIEPETITLERPDFDPV